MKIKVPDHISRRPGLVTRRKFVTTALGGAAWLGMGPGNALAQSSTPTSMQAQTLRGQQFDLSIGYTPVNFTGAERLATTVNNSLPAPILRWREGDEVTLRVRNNLAVDSSIHWHGIILPSNMDGVPGLSFAGIRPGESFEYRFRVNQHGTYWYHSHSGHQEQTGLYGPIIIDPREQDPVDYQRDYVVMLSDWSDTGPHDIYARLRKESHYYNFQRRTIADIISEIRNKGLAETWQDRAMWNQMRMSDRDIADVTAYTYTYLMNGVSPDPGWLGLFEAGEKVRLRFINGSAMTLFDVRIPGLKMTVVAADGQNIEPVTVDEFRIGVAETYDVLVEPEADSAYTLFAQSIDRSGYALGTLTDDVSLRAPIPAMDPRPVLGMEDMGMDMSGMSHSDHATGMDMSSSAMDQGSMQGHEHHAGMDMSSSAMEQGSMQDHEHHAGMDMSSSSMDQESMQGHEHHAGMDMSAEAMSEQSTAGHDGHEGMTGTMPMAESSLAGRAGFGSNQTNHHQASEFGPQVDMRTQNAVSGLNDPGVGLREHQQRYNRRVLTYADIRNLYPTLDRREPEREIQLHLTGNMHRYFWSFDGIPYAEAEPLRMRFGERLRITLVNDTMMTHPIHLHGLWSELETGDPERIPRKHTVLVQPGKKISYLVTADAMGNWAYHCHLLYHMTGMFREVIVS